MKTTILFLVTAFSANVQAQAPAFTAHWEGAADMIKIRENDKMWNPYGESDTNEDYLEDFLWSKEQQYWQYVRDGDAENYRKLFDESLMKHSDDSAKEVNSPPMAKTTGIGRYNCKLVRKSEKVFDNTAIVFYEVAQSWTNATGKIVKSNTLEVTHTWKKTKGEWLIINSTQTTK